ncbi:response regulator [Pedobacter rhizosphaerae]|uniref:Response regulator receiver domain-containing protein n=1 Tax=Pedobacter rhizosphaerae TaxID=390241 RepID=A0A1H9M089_9SPHI|nr:response regulator transcription factor [Pedobacter rhizosphaerae]SER17086.1 Response regulator receiver domain-containing protein [Pedobacter rhizosphaerae]
MKQHPRILIVDDNDLMRTLMSNILKKLIGSSDLKQASNLTDAFTLLGQDSFDLLLLDINMPQGDSSPETVAQIKEMQPQMKVCMFSGNDKSILAQSFLDAGAIGFIQKDNTMGSSAAEIVKMVFG